MFLKWQRYLPCEFEQLIVCKGYALTYLNIFIIQILLPIKE